MGKFAEGTAVPVDKTKTEIESTLIRFGATGFVSAWMGTSHAIMFEMHGRRVKFVLPMPDPQDRKFTFLTKNSWRPDASAKVRKDRYDGEVRRLWRSLLLCIKAKLEIVESGIATFEEEFLSHVVLPDGRTVGQWMGPQIATVYETGRMPPLLLGSGGE